LVAAATLAIGTAILMLGIVLLFQSFFEGVAP